jgi:hypothetical protein
MEKKIMIIDRQKCTRKRVVKRQGEYYSAIDLERVNETGDPERVTQTVRGSLPNCSVGNPFVLVGATGKVIGMAVLQVLPLAVTVTPEIWPLLIV